jgi:phage terminase large subunit-like protein
VLRQIRGGLDKMPEGLLLITTTQSDDIPAGAFKSELKLARNIRDCKYRGRVIRPMLPVLYEFPREIAELTREERARGEVERWKDPANWPMVMPNLGRSIHLPNLIADWESEREKGDEAIKVWASQHLNIEIGVGINNEGWRGADFWEAAADESQTLEALLERSEVVSMGAASTICSAWLSSVATRKRANGCPGRALGSIRKSSSSARTSRQTWPISRKRGHCRLFPFRRTSPSSQ